MNEKHQITVRDEHKMIGRIMARFPDIADEERTVLEEWLKIPGNRELFEDIMESRKETFEEYFNIGDIEESRIKFNSLLDQLKTEKPVTAIKGNFRWNRWSTYITAASVLVFTSVAAYIWLQKEKNGSVAKTEITATVNDAAPGMFRAKLVLSDGRSVILDSAQQGVLANQGGTEVRNEDGKLVYRPNTNTKEVLYNTLVTARGESYAGILSDGSRIWLNSESSIKYPVNFAGQKERVVFITGEVYFEISHSPIPFITKGNSNGQAWSVKVLGTHYNVNTYGDHGQVQATLLEGKVRVSTPGNKVAVLSPGEQAQFSEANDLRLLKADVEKVTAWKDDMFYFDNDDVKEVMAQLCRWYDLKVEYQGTITKKCKAIVPRNVPVSTVLSMFEKSGTAHFKLEGKTITVMP